VWGTNLIINLRSSTIYVWVHLYHGGRGTTTSLSHLWAHIISDRQNAMNICSELSPMKIFAWLPLITTEYWVQWFGGLYPILGGNMYLQVLMLDCEHVCLKKIIVASSLFRSAKSLSCYIRTGLEYVRYPKSWCSWSSLVVDTVDGRNPAPVDKLFIPLIIGFQPYKVMQDFFHPQLLIIDSWWFIIDSWSSIYVR